MEGLAVRLSVLGPCGSGARLGDPTVVAGSYWWYWVWCLLIGSGNDPWPGWVVLTPSCCMVLAQCTMIEIPFNEYDKYFFFVALKDALSKSVVVVVVCGPSADLLNKH